MVDAHHLTVDLVTEDLDKTGRELLSLLESPEITTWTIQPDIIRVVEGSKPNGQDGDG